MRTSQTRWVLALTALLVVLWSSMASGDNGDGVRAGRLTVATHQTSLNTIQSKGAGLAVGLAGASHGAALRGNSVGLGIGVFGSSKNGVGIRATSQSNAAPALSAINSAGQPAASFQVTGGSAPFIVNSNTIVPSLNADQVDGASIVSGRVVNAFFTNGDVILQIPGFGDVEVASCDTEFASFRWHADAVAFVTWLDLANPGDALVDDVKDTVVTGSEPYHFVMAQLARNTGAATSIVTLTVTTEAADCTFAAQAVVQPG
jgi:hypothetical protein